ncbi:MAG: prepilin-type N-terminal cleavage/methylation domain-containing protein [Candidatus Paceibacterota bacterium]|jgi:type II secretory pathway pseudopilin PulG
MLYVKNKKRIEGFTLVESLVAISILMVAIVAPMTIAQKGLGSASYSKDQMTASFLAQDAIEFIKNKRDEIGLRKVAVKADPIDAEWLGSNSALILLDIYNKCLNQTCYVDTVIENISNTPSNVYLIRNSSDHSFIYYGNQNSNSGYESELSKFKREVTVKYPASSSLDEALITVKVSWPGETITVQSFIYNYWENL